MQQTTKAWARIQRDIEERLQNPIEGKRLSALRINPEKEKKVATRKQIAAARRNIKKAQAARRKKNPRRRVAKKRAAPKRRKRAAPKRRRRRRNPSTTAAKTTRRRPARRRTNTVAAPPAPATRRRRRRNPWYGDTEGHRAAAKKGIRRKKRAAAKRRTARRSPSRRRARRPSKKRASQCARCLARRRRNPTTELALLENPSGGLLPNAGPFSASSVKGYLAAAGGVTVGLVVADFVDRFVATRKPTGTDAVKGVGPWYGRAAAAAIAKRPDAMRLGVQAGGAVVGILGTYYTRNMSNIIPWLLGGVAVGFGANLFKMLADWWVMPALLKVEAKDATKPSLGNRTYPLEQTFVQDDIDKLFEQWTNVPNLVAQQQEKPVIESVLTGTVNSGLALSGVGVGQLGGAGQKQSPSEAAANGGRGELLMTGRLGACPKCGGVNGCFSSCPELGGCPTCPDGKVSGVGGFAPRCRYTVKPGDDFRQIIGVAGADPAVINQLNGGQSPHQYWRPGNTVMMPFHLCKHMESNSSAPAQQSLGAAEQSGPDVPPNGASPEKFALNFAARDD